MNYVSAERRGIPARVIRKLSPKGLLTWALLLLIAYSITSGLVMAVPNLDLSLVAVVAILGVTVGWILAQVPVKAWVAALLSFLLGMEFLLVRIGHLGTAIMAIAGSAARAVAETIRWYWTGQAPDWMAVWTLALALWQGMGTLLGRTVGWLSALLAGSTTFDVVGAALVWGLMVWVFSVWAGWVVRREYNPVLGVLPGSILLAFVLSYTGSSPYVFLPVFGATLVLMALMYQLQREVRWARVGIDFSQGLWSDVAMLATGLAVVFVIAAAIAPSITIERVKEWVEEVTERPSSPRSEGVAEGLGLEPKPEPRPVRPIESMMSTSLPQRHLIGSGPELSRQVVMVIETGEFPSLPEDMRIEDLPRHYWRSITYDRYFGRGWSTSPTELAEYEAGELVTQEEGSHLRTLRQTVRLVGPQGGGIIHVDGTLVSVDEDFVVSWRPPGEIFAATTEVQEYRADSVYPLVTAEELREASVNYPDWILSRYLQLPDTVPSRVLNLAFELTATQPTPYDRAVAIETYLRETFPYTLDVPTPGFQSDIADYFLFELQEGYCDYYATSMVVLARAAGLPTRLVIGYVTGSYDPMAARYVVTEADAHAWPEVYFPDYGWIEFEPTGGRAPIVRSTELGSSTLPDRTASEPLVEPRRQVAPEFVVGIWLALVFGAVLSAVGLATAADSMRLYLLTPEKLVVRVQRRLRAQALRVRAPLRRGDTPHEVAAALGMRIRAIAGDHGFTGIEFLEPAAEEVRALTDLYVRIWYSPEATLSRQERWKVAWLWWRLRWRLALARLWRRSGTRRPPDDELEISVAPEERQRQKDRAQERLRPPPA